MAKRTRIKFFSKGFRKILLSDSTKSLVYSEAQGMARRANMMQAFGDEEGYKGYVFKGGYGGGRWVGKVASVNFSGDFDQSQNQTLTKVSNGGA